MIPALTSSLLGALSLVAFYVVGFAFGYGLAASRRGAR